MNPKVANAAICRFEPGFARVVEDFPERTLLRLVDRPGAATLQI
jgi:hypothetical protein